MDLPSYVFVLTMLLPVFGGEVKAHIHLSDMESCERFRHVVAREMAQMTMKATVSPCVEERHT